MPAEVSVTSIRSSRIFLLMSESGKIRLTLTRTLAGAPTLPATSFGKRASKQATITERRVGTDGWQTRTKLTLMARAY